MMSHASLQASGPDPPLKLHHSLIFDAPCPVLPSVPQKPFDGAMYNMMGSPYAMLEGDVMVYAQPYKVGAGGRA